MAGDKVLKRYESLTSALFAIRGHYMMATDPIRGNGPILHPGDFPGDQNSQNPLYRGADPVYRDRTPTQPTRQGFSYNEDEIQHIPPNYGSTFPML